MVLWLPQTLKLVTLVEQILKISLGIHPSVDYVIHRSAKVFSMRAAILHPDIGISF